jgi:cytoskeleton protein RodZ
VNATDEPLPGDADVQPLPAASMASPGARLRAAREAAGLSLDQVAQQLKLAQRQVKALEDENFAELPGRTFSRGFVRNYARLLNLDPEDLLLHLPDVAHAPALGSPALHSTGAMMAELPNTASVKPNVARWMIPLVLIACIVAAAAYEWYRGRLALPGEALHPSVSATDVQAGPSAVTTLPNPLASEGRPATGDRAVVSEDKLPASVNVPIDAPPTAQGTPPSPATSGAATATDAPLVLAYAGPSWTEIRDRTGQLLVSRLVEANAVEPVRGTPPFDVVLGNARVVTLTYRGKPIDLTPYTRHNVARLTLK